MEFDLVHLSIRQAGRRSIAALLQPRVNAHQGVCWDTHSDHLPPPQKKKEEMSFRDGP